ncbi:hypothetical protein CHRYSEO8AT_320013 [Chryseobacterium sp. 8AT]|nr:hypothetical protein CHRYSEO8AT_320013 [Chryseobacterium sp. 8AT]
MHYVYILIRFAVIIKDNKKLSISENKKEHQITKFLLVL